MDLDLGLISASNGWAIAITGAIIVMLGLSLLAFVISKLHKIIMLFEQKQTVKATSLQQKTCLHDQTDAEIDFLNDLEAAAKLYKVISEDLGKTFELSGLYRITQKCQLPHPHMTIRSLREAGFLVPSGEGQFTWRNC